MFAQIFEEESYPTKKKFCNPVVLESICYRTRAYRLINESNTTIGLRKIWMGMPRPSEIVGYIHSVEVRDTLYLSYLEIGDT